MAVVKNLMLRGGADFSGITKETKRAQQTLSDFQKNVSRTMSAIKTTLITVGIGKIIKDSITSAMNVEASIQQIDRIMGQNSDTFKQWANNQAIAYNMSKQEALKYGSVYGNLISGFAKDTGDTMKYTEDLLKSSSIVASATGRTMEDVMDRIRSGMLGNTEAIEDLGINVNVAMIESTDAFKKFANGKSWQQLSFQTQQQIRLFAILEQSSKKYGDSVNQNTSSSLQQLVAQLKNVQLSLGQAFLPIVQTVLPALTSLASKLAYVSSLAAQFSQALFGKGGSQRAQIKATSNQASAVGDLGDSYKEAGKAAKGALAGFDEINSFNESSGGGSASEGTVATLAPMEQIVPGSDTQNLEVSKSIEETINRLMPMLQPAITAFEQFKSSLSTLVENIGINLKWFYDEVLVPLGTWTISEVVPGFLNLLSGAIDILNPLIEALRPLGVWFLNSFLKPIASWTADAFIGTLDLIAKSLKTIGDWMSDNKPVVEGITVTVASFIAAWKLTELFAFIQMSGGIVSALTAITTAIKAGIVAKIADKAETIILTALYAKDFVMSLFSGTAALVKQAAQFAINTGLKLKDVVAQAAMTAATLIWNGVAVIATTVTTALSAAIAFLTSPIGLVVLAISALIAIGVLLYQNWDTVKAKSIEIFSYVKEFVSSNMSATYQNILTIINGVKSIFNGLITFITGVFTGNWSKAWEGVRSIFKGIFDTLFGIVKAPLNLIIDAINTVIRGLNSIHFDIPDWVPFVGGKSFGISIPSIPKLAKGGIIDSPTTALIGEAGTEMVVPLENTSFVDKLASALGTAVMSAMQFSNNGNSQGDVILQIDGTTLGRILGPVMDREQQRIGKSLIIQTT